MALCLANGAHQKTRRTAKYLPNGFIETKAQQEEFALVCPEGLEPPDLLLRRQLLYPVELRALEGENQKWMVGAVGFELTTLCSQSRCATRLRYAPTQELHYSTTPKSAPDQEPMFLKQTFSCENYANLIFNRLFRNWDTQAKWQKSCSTNISLSPRTNPKRARST